MTPQEIVKKVADELGLDFDCLINIKKNRKAHNVIPRNCLMLYFKFSLKLTHEKIAEIFNIKHSTVTHDIKKTQKILNSREYCVINDRLSEFIEGRIDTLKSYDYYKVMRFIHYVADFFGTSFIEFTKKGRQKNAYLIEIKYVLINFLFSELKLSFFEICRLFKIEPSTSKYNWTFSMMCEMDGHYDLKTLKKLWNELNN